MGRKRERFERSDVPRDTPHRNLIALLVLVVIAAVGFLLIKTLWSRVQVESNMGDPDLSGCLDEQPGPTALEGAFYYTDNDIEKILFVQVDDPSAEHPTLKGAQLLLIDEVAGTAHLVDVPLNVRVTSEGATYTFEEHFASFGPVATIPLITTSFNIYADHVIVGTTVPWGAIQGLAGTNQFNVLGTNPDFVKSMHTDMDGGDLVDHGELFAIKKFQKNPYILADDIKGVGFLRADEIARTKNSTDIIS